MPYICWDCPNKTSFLEDVWGRCSWSATNGVDENLEDNGDYGDTDYDDYDTEDKECPTCANCESSNTEDVSDEEWEAWKGPLPDTKVKDEKWKDFLIRRKK